MAGKLVELNLRNVRGNADKTMTYLKGQIPAEAQKRGDKGFTVVFLGETHGNAIDQAVAKAVLTNPPLTTDATKMCAILERQLEDVYETSLSHFFDMQGLKKEGIDLAAGRLARSIKIAQAIMDLAECGDKTLFYVVFGSAHGKEIFDALQKSTLNFTFLLKMDNDTYST